MTNPLVFVDCETTSLRADRLPWEVALIRVDELDEGPSVRQIRMFILDPDLSEADPFALKVGQFYERHPQANGTYKALTADQEWFELYDESAAMHIVERWTRDATIVGAVPSFDTEVLANRMRWHGLCPSWNHRLICVENLVAGRLQWLPENRMQGMGKAAEQLGIDLIPELAHTAMGDAQLARRIFDEVFS